MFRRNRRNKQGQSAKRDATCRDDSSPKMLAQSGGLFCLFAFDVTSVRATAKEFNGAKKYGPHAGHYFLLRNLRCETNPIELGHVSIDSPFFLRFPSPSRKVCFFPLEMTGGALVGGFPWPRASGSNGQEAGPALLECAQGLHAPENRSHHLRVGTDFLSVKVYHHHQSNGPSTERLTNDCDMVLAPLNISQKNKCFCFYFEKKQNFLFLFLSEAFCPGEGQCKPVVVPSLDGHATVK